MEYEQKTAKMSKPGANLGGMGGIVLFNLYTCLLLNSVYLSTRWNGGMKTNRVVLLIHAMTISALGSFARCARTSPAGRHGTIPPTMTSSSGMAPLSACRLLIGRDCHVTRRTYSDGTGGLCQSRPELRGGRMGLAHARDDVIDFGFVFMMMVQSI